MVMMRMVVAVGTVVVPSRKLWAVGGIYQLRVAGGMHQLRAVGEIHQRAFQLWKEGPVEEAVVVMKVVPPEGQRCQQKAGRLGMAVPCSRTGVAA